MSVRLASSEDRDTIWNILEPMIRAGETYTLPRDMSREQALEYWFAPEKETFVWEENDVVLGTYFLKANQQGGGAGAWNCAGDVFAFIRTSESSRLSRHAIQPCSKHE